MTAVLAPGEPDLVTEPARGRRTSGGRAKTFGLVMDLLLGIENAALAVSGVVQFHPHPIQEATAITYLNEYYFREAVAHPQGPPVAWTTSNFVQAKRQEGYASYEEYWGPVKRVDPGSVRAMAMPDQGDQNTFEIAFTRELDDGSSQKKTTLMRFTCADWIQAYVPGFACSPDHLRLDFTRQLTQRSR